MSASWKTTSVMPLSSALGAEIGGVDIASGIGEEPFGKGGSAHSGSQDGKDRYRNLDAATRKTTHPAIVRHPLSGRPDLYVNSSFTVKFGGWCKEESKPLLECLWQHASRDEITCCFKCREGSIAIWDNIATHHRARNRYHGERRLMHRIAFEGEELFPAAST